MRRIFAGPAFLVLAGLLIFGPHAPRGGLHTDDHEFHLALSRADFPAARTAALRYVPGRNLNVIYYWLLYRLLGPSPARLHVVGLALTLLNAVLAWALCAQMRLPAALRLLAAGLFLVYPNHGETHFWSLAITQNTLPTTLIFIAALLAGSAKLKPAPRLILTLAVYALAFFDYDQAFFMWIPLLFYLSFAVPGADAPFLYKAAAVVFCLLMSSVHVLARIYAPISNGGRPVIRFANVFRSFGHALISSFVPMQKLPYWDFLSSWAGGAVPTVLMVAALALAWVKLSAALWSGEAPAHAPALLRAGAFGLLWFFCAYLPNYFWYVSPRHNYIPSFGLLLALVAAAALLLQKARPAARAGVAVFAFLAFGLFAAADVAEGCAWARSSALLESFGARAAALLPANPDNLFLVGAPTTLGRAPAFKHPREAAYAYAEASGYPPPSASDLQLAPARSGFFYYNGVDLFGEDSMIWRSYSGAHLLTYGAGGKIGCAKSLLLTPPGLPAVAVPVPSGAACAETLSLDVPAWLVSSESAAPAGAALLSADGAALTALSLREGARWISFTLRWRADAPVEKDFAAVLTLLDASGRVVFSPVFSSTVPGRTTDRSLWPAYDDLAPPSTWKPGTGRVQVFRYRRGEPLPPGALSARISIYERTPGGPWRKSGPFAAAVDRS